MSARGDDSSDFERPERDPEAPEEELPPEGEGSEPGPEATAPDDDTPAGAVPVVPRRRRRGRIALICAAAVALVMIVTVALPAGREGLQNLWCEVTGGVCPGEAPPITEEEQAEELDRRMRVDPEEAALWGNYVALGDSYSSGDGAGEYDPETMESGGCWRSENAYPRLVAEEFDFAGSLGFFACSSHKGSQMLEQIGTPESQIERVTEHTSLVTVGIGGNDLGFIPVLRTCIVRMPIVENTACVDQEDEVNERMDTFEETLTEVLWEVHERAPDARILVLGYPRLFPEEPQSMYYTLSVSDQLWLNSVAQNFNNRIRDTAYRVDGEVYGEREVGSVEYVNVSSALNGYEVSADEAWLNGIVLGELGEGLRVDRASFHPTAEGQMSIADRVRQQIEEGPERTLYVTRETVEEVDEDTLTSELGGPLDPRGPDGNPEDEAEEDAGDETEGTE